MLCTLNNFTYKSQIFKNTSNRNFKIIFLNEKLKKKKKTNE